MAITRFYNVVGSTLAIVELLSAGSIPSKINSILITNIHGSNAAEITLSLTRSTSTGSEHFKILNSLSLPSKTSILIDDPGVLKIDPSFSLQIKVGSSDTVDVFINT